MSKSLMSQPVAGFVQAQYLDRRSKLCEGSGADSKRKSLVNQSLDNLLQRYSSSDKNSKVLDGSRADGKGKSLIDRSLDNFVQMYRAYEQKGKDADAQINGKPVVDTPVISPHAQYAVDYYAAARSQSVNAGQYFSDLDNTLSAMGTGASVLTNLKESGVPTEGNEDYNNAINNIQSGLSAMYAKEGMSAADITDRFNQLHTADDYLAAVSPYNNNIMNANERIQEANAEPESREYSFDGEMYTFPDGRQLSRDNYVLLCNVVAHEAGCGWLDIKEKGKCVGAIMNRCGGDTNNLPAVLGDASQFAGNSAYVGQTEFTSNVTQQCEDAVIDYFCYPEKYDEQNYYFWYGDGVKNYFTRNYADHVAVGNAVQCGDLFSAQSIEYESENAQRNANREARYEERVAMAELIDCSAQSDPSMQMEAW